MLVAMADIYEKLEELQTSVDNLSKRVEKIEETTVENPSITWLLRFKTWPTITVIMVIFIFLSLWFVSDFRKAILPLFGLPPDIVP